MEREKSTDKIVTKFEEERDEQLETCLEKYTSCRWILAYVGCLGFTVLYALRINLGLAIVCMLKPDNSSTQSSVSVCQASDNPLNSTRPPVYGEIEWDNNLRAQVLGSFFYGYIVTQIPGGYLAGRFGGKRVLGVGMFIYALATIAFPFAARYDRKDYQTSAILAITLRVIMGLATGVVFPAMHNLWGKWAPPFERSKLIVLCYSGTMVGNVLMLGTGGYFCEWTSFDGGWPSIFYLGGGLCLVFCLVWTFLVYDSPLQHPRISMKECNYIIQSMEGNQESKNVSVPWLEIAKSPAFWAIVAAHTCNNFGNYTLLTQLPTFMQQVLGFDIKSNGLYSTLPYIAMFVVANTFSTVIDTLRERKVLATVTARKIAMVLAFIVPAGFLVATGWIPCGRSWLGVLFLTVAVAFTGFNRSGYNTNHVDIAPRYAGELFGLTNTIATIPGMISPPIIAAMTSITDDKANDWKNVFYVWAAVYTFGCLIYTIFAKGSIQDWAVEPGDKELRQSKAKTSRKQGKFTLAQLDD